MKINLNKPKNQLLIDKQEYEEENRQLDQDLKILERKNRGLLWLWLLIPILGIIIFLVLLSHRKQQPDFLKISTDLKTKITTNMLYIKLIEKKILELSTDNENDTL